MCEVIIYGPKDPWLLGWGEQDPRAPLNYVRNTKGKLYFNCIIYILLVAKDASKF